MKKIRGIHVVFALVAVLLIIVPSASLIYYISQNGFHPQEIFYKEKNLTDRLTVPEVQKAIFDENYVKRPKINSTGADYKGLVFYLNEPRLYDEGVEGTFVTIVNKGDREVFIHSYELVSKDRYITTLRKNTSHYLWDGSAYDAGYFELPAISVNEPIPFVPCASIYVQEGDYEESNWSDYGIQCYGEINVTLVGDTSKYRKVNVSKADFLTETKVKARITPLAQEVRNTVGRIAAYQPGSYNVDQICDAYEWVKDNINYVDDPRGSDYWTYPEETLYSEVGDCEDQSFLLASVIESMGGTTKIYLTQDHAFTAFYAGNNESVKEIKNAMKERYDVPRIASIKDKYGDWIILDLTCGYFPGDMPCDAISLDDELYFEKDTNVSEVYD